MCFSFNLNGSRNSNFTRVTPHKFYFTPLWLTHKVWWHWMSISGSSICLSALCIPPMPTPKGRSGRSGCWVGLEGRKFPGHTELSFGRSTKGRKEKKSVLLGYKGFFFSLSLFISAAAKVTFGENRRRKVFPSGKWSLRKHIGFPAREKRSISGRTTTSVFPHLALIFYLPFYLLLSPPHLRANIQSAPRLFPKHEQVDADNVLEKKPIFTLTRLSPTFSWRIFEKNKKRKGRRKEALKNSKKAWLC